MTPIQRLARCAKRVLRLPDRKSADSQSLKRRANAQLRHKLPPHLLKDVGADDG
ncbi:MAG: hypothetical protein Q8L84_00910 [Hyphomonas sp.]|nr:hypothetical protein [Hyphomonas sp.]